MDLSAGGAGSSPPPIKDSAPDSNRPANPLTSPEGVPDSDQATIQKNDDGATTVSDVEDKGKGVNHEPSSTQQKASSATCIPKATERIKVDLPSHRINSEIQYMQDHALIGKFMGFWPTEKELHGWIASKWKPKGQVTLQLGPKGFFTAIFHYLEDKSRIFDGRPYFSTHRAYF